MPTADEEPSLAAFASRIVAEQRYVEKQARFIEAQRARREKGATYSTEQERRNRGRARANANKQASTWSKERCLEVLRAWHAEHGAWPRSSDWGMKEEGRPSAETVRKRFGTWAAAIEEAQG